MSSILVKLLALVTPCTHEGLTTPLRTFRGAEIWRCELCGRPVLVADEVELG
jgi:hypothetical protein